MASITTIQGTDSVRDSRAVINQNFTNINNELTTISGLGGIPGPTGPAGPTGAMGTGITWRSTWSSATSYSANDAVTYGGSAWVAKASSTNVTPGTDVTKWESYINFSSLIVASMDSGLTSARPAQPTVQDTGFLPTDGPYLYQSDGTTWNTFGTMRKMVPLDDSTWSWLNQGSAAMSSVGPTRMMTVPASATDSLRCRIRSVPSTPYTITALFLNDFYPSNYYHAGLVLYASGTGRLQTWGYGYNNNNSHGVVAWTNTTTFSANTNGPFQIFTPYTFLRIVDDGTNLTFSSSSHGFDFSNVFTTTTRAAFIGTITDIGIVGDSGNNKPGNMLVLHWEIT